MPSTGGRASRRGTAWCCKHPMASTSARQSFYGDASPTTRDRMRKYEEEAGALAVAAARSALVDAQVAPERVTHLVTVSCTGFYAPGFDIALIKQMGLADGHRSHPGRIHGLPWSAQRPAGGSGLCRRRPGGLRVARARSRCAACTTSTAGMPNRSSPTHSLPMGPARSSSVPAAARSDALYRSRRVGLDADSPNPKTRCHGGSATTAFR